MKYLLIFLCILLLFRWISGFIMPIFRMTNATNDRIRQMQQQMMEMERKRQEEQQQAFQRRNSRKEGDYIDYEELK